MENQKIKLDKKDQKILTELTLNSRIALKELAKKVGISREVATYRLNKLKEQGIIKKFYTIIAVEEALDFSRYGCFFQLKGVTQKEETEFLNYLKKHKFVTYLGPNIGKWNLIFDVYAKDKLHLKQLIDEISKKLGKNLKKYAITSLETGLESFPAKIFGSKKQIKFNETKDYNVKGTDLKILKILSQNSRAEYTEIAEKLNMTANAIKYRLKKLENNGIIKGYTIPIDYKKLGYEFYNMQIKTENKKDEEIKEFLRKNPYTIYFYKYFGNENWDLDIGLLVEGSSQLREFILKLREHFGDIAEINEIYLIIEETKGNYAPEGVFEK